MNIDQIGHKVLPWLDEVLTVAIQTLDTTQQFVRAWRALWEDDDQSSIDLDQVLAAL